MLNSDQVAKSIIALNRKKYIRSLIKAAIWWSVSIVAMILTARSNSVLNPSVRPLTFGAVTLVLLIIPVLRYRLYRVLTRPSFSGIVKSCRDIAGREPRTDINIGTIANGWELEPVWVYSVKVEDRHGRVHSFVFSSLASQGYARDHIKAGDRVRYAFGGRYPWNEHLVPDSPFCPNCGGFGAANETHCTCGCLYLKKIQDE